MTTAQRNKNLEYLIEQKIVELYGDPDAGLTLKKSFVEKLRKSMRDSRKVAPVSLRLHTLINKITKKNKHGYAWKNVEPTGSEPWVA